MAVSVLESNDRLVGRLMGRSVFRETEKKGMLVVLCMYLSVCLSSVAGRPALLLGFTLVDRKYLYLPCMYIDVSRRLGQKLRLSSLSRCKLFCGRPGGPVDGQNRWEGAPERMQQDR